MKCRRHGRDGVGVIRGLSAGAITGLATSAAAVAAATGGKSSNEIKGTTGTTSARQPLFKWIFRQLLIDLTDLISCGAIRFTFNFVLQLYTLENS